MGINKKAISKIFTFSRVLTGLVLDKGFKGKVQLQFHSLAMSPAEARGRLFLYIHMIKDFIPLHFIGDEEEAVSVNGRKNC